MSKASTPIHLRITGLLLIVVLITVTILYHDIANIFWLCNISTLLAGLALLCGWPQTALTGATYMIVGLIFWMLNVLINNTFGNTISYITHFCFAITAVYLFYRIPVGHNLWLRCFCWYLFSQLLSRLFTPPEENINMVFGIWPGWEVMFKSFFVFWCCTTIACLGFLFLLNKLIFRWQQGAKSPIE